MATKTQVETETETNTITATGGACAVGAGLLAVACKGMVLGFFGGLAAIFGFTSLSGAPLMVMVLGLAGLLVWLGFRHAGTKAVATALAGVATMWWGYMLTGALTQGSWAGTLFAPSDFLTHTVEMVPIVALYLSGTALFLMAVYIAYLKPTGVSTGATVGGVAVLTMCSGSGITGVVGGGAVAVLGTTGALAPGVILTMAIGGLALIGLALYKRAFKQAGLIGAGIFVGYFLPWRLMDHVYAFGEDARLVVGVSLTYVGMAMMFLGLFWVYRPHMNLLPRSWSQANPMRVLRASLKG